MDSQVAIIADSLACLPKDLMAQFHIGLVPIRLLFRGRVYRDLVDITPSQAYELFLQDPEAFNTSPSSPGHYLEAYREASRQAESILCITLSSKLSTGYEMACVAREQARTELPEVAIEVMDSRTVTASEGLIALAAARSASEGKNLVETVRIAADVRSKVNFLIVLDTIRYVYRTGRIPKVAAQVGAMLNIKPILTSSSGLVRFAGAARSKKDGVDRILQTMKRNVGDSPVHIAVMHAYAPDEAERLKERAASQFRCAEIWVSEFSPVMGYACGTGAVGFAFYREE